MTAQQDYARIWQDAQDNPQDHWAQAAQALDWDRAWSETCAIGANGLARWFVSGMLNACYNCVDRHVEAGYGDDTALIYESAVTSTSSVTTFAQLQDSVARLAGAISAHGVSKGDRVLIYLPNSPQAVMAMLACARIGAVHSVVFGGFAAPELAKRIDDARPELLLTASCGIEAAKVIAYQPILDNAYARAAHQPSATIVWQRQQSEADLDRADWFDWDAQIADAAPMPCIPVEATHPLYLLYTSGTTGKPKGIVRDTGGHLATLQWSMTAVYDCPAGETFWAASDVGWVVGHSYICYAPLLNRNATVIFEGKPVGTPDAGIFWRLIAKHKVSAFFTAPTAIRAIKQADPDGVMLQEADLSGLRAIFLAGERTDPATLEWLGGLLDLPVVDHWWQTETGSAICGTPLGIERLPIKPGAAGVPMPGWDLICLDEQGQPVAAGESGAIVAKLPLPPGFASGIWEDEAQFHASYFAEYPGYYMTGDAGYLDKDGYCFVMARVDDVINVAGHRLSSSAMEEVLAQHPAVSECAVIGRADELKGQVPLGFVVLKSGQSPDAKELEAQLVANVRAEIGPVAALKQVHVIAALPKTRSGKILRKTIRQLADGENPADPATIDNPAALHALRAIFE